MRVLSLLTIAAAAGLAAAPAAAAEPIPVLLIDGQNNHNWQQTTPILKAILQDGGRFRVDVATAPGKLKLPEKPKAPTPEQDRQYKEEVARLQAAHKAEVERFHPDLGKYQAVVSNYNGDPWGRAFNDDLEGRVKAGKLGLVIVHAANNAFGGWKEYYQMIGMGWQGPKFGDRLYVDAAGNEVREKAGVGLGSGHRYVGPFTVTVRNADHPITRGMPREWLHARDELYDNMRGPIENVQTLATAYSDKEKKGTGVHEPMIWTVAYGKGRVFHTPMGHDAVAMRCHGFAAVVRRGTEWAATGDVTIPLPREFPTAQKVSPIEGK